MEQSSNPELPSIDLSKASLSLEGKVAVTDVTDRSQYRAMAEAALAEFGRIDILVNNAGWTAI